jgi:N-formylglutamate deformylase
MNHHTHTLHLGSTPLLLSLPHVGTALSPGLAERLQGPAAEVSDTDWHLEQVYAFARALGASVLVPRYSRYVVDLNRPPENTPMYPGVNNTGLCPLHAFSGAELYRPGQAPGEAEIAQRVQQYWQPYHGALQGELARLKARHGHAMLWDGHSIASQLPWLFEGRLPDLNLGTASGASCAPGLRARLAALLAAQPHFSHAVDGRFKGGYITRRYGQPAQGVHAVQLEMAFATYLQAEAPPWALDTARLAGQLQPLLEQLLAAMIEGPEHG